MRIFGTILAALAIILAPGSVFAVEKIDAFQVQIQVNPDSTIQVVEQITYDFGTGQRHGIYREIPYKYQRNNLNYNYRIEVVDVVDAKGGLHQYEISRSNGMYQIKIGDPNATVTGINTYQITYKVERALNYFDSHDELYWNVTGNGWGVPINLANAIVKLPGQVEGPNLKVECFYGPYGSSTKCSQATTGNSEALFYQSNMLPAEGLTVVVGFPKI